MSKKKIKKQFFNNNSNRISSKKRRKQRSYHNAQSISPCHFNFHSFIKSHKMSNNGRTLFFHFIYTGSSSSHSIGSKQRMEERLFQLNESIESMLHIIKKYTVLLLSMAGGEEKTVGRRTKFFSLSLSCSLSFTTEILLSI